MKKLIIKLFGLHDIEDIIYRTVRKEQIKAERETNERLHQQNISLTRKHNLELQAKDAEIRLLSQKMLQMEQKEKEIEALEYKAKKQIKANISVASEISMLISSFVLSVNKVTAEIDGAKDIAERHQKKIGG